MNLINYQMQEAFGQEALKIFKIIGISSTKYIFVKSDIYLLYLHAGFEQNEKTSEEYWRLLHTDGFDF